MLQPLACVHYDARDIFSCQLAVAGTLRFSGVSRWGGGGCLVLNGHRLLRGQLFITLLVRLDKIQAIGEREARHSSS